VKPFSTLSADRRKQLHQRVATLTPEIISEGQKRKQRQAEYRAAFRKKLAEQERRIEEITGRAFNSRIYPARKPE
jgi:transcription elongation GreA/GreB family factor